MTKDDALKLFSEMIKVAEATLHEFTLNSNLSVDRKADKSVVTVCDKAIDLKLSQIANNKGLRVVSEEGKHVLNIVKAGDYITIDPIDGTLGYIDYVNYALDHGGVQNFLKEDLGPKSDFCLLLGVVEKGTPKYAACYNYITKENIFIDGNESKNLIRKNNIRNYAQENAIYLDQRFINDPITQKLLSLSDVSPITQATFGLKTLYTILNPHKNAVTVHRVQSAGLWDVMPTAVAARAFGGKIYDDQGDELKLKEYIMLPGKGGTVIKGDKFKFVTDLLKS